MGLEILGVKYYEDYRRYLYGEITHKALLVNVVGTLIVPSQSMAQIINIDYLRRRRGRFTATLAALGTRPKPSPTLPVPRLDWNAETKATWHSCTPNKGQPTQQENELRVEICFGIELVTLVPESVSLVMVNSEEKRIKSERLGFNWVGPQVGRGQTANKVLMIN
ncbi:hypothetical protein ACFX2I_043208 [Malus domestica]